jgi:hypothetical protein
MTEPDGDVAAEAETENESEREIQLVEDDSGFWTLVDSAHGAVGDAPTKAAGLTLMETYLEDIDVDIPDVIPEEPPEDDRPEQFPPAPSDLDDSE